MYNSEKLAKLFVIIGKVYAALSTIGFPIAFGFVFYNLGRNSSFAYLDVIIGLIVGLWIGVFINIILCSLAEIVRNTEKSAAAYEKMARNTDSILEALMKNNTTNQKNL